MKQKLKRLLALVLVLCICLPMLPMEALAATDYLSQCTKYSTYLILEATSAEDDIKTLPCSWTTNIGSKDVRAMKKGETYTCLAIYKNTAGSYWYEVTATSDNKSGYIYGGTAKFKSFGGNAVLSDVTIATTTPKQGIGCAVKGSITKVALGEVTIHSATGVLKDAQGKTQTKTITSGFDDISKTALNKDLKFGQLCRGPGSLTITTKYSCKDTNGTSLTDQAAEIKQTINFTVQGTYSIIYDANGGTNAPASQTKTYGKKLTLSTSIPSRSGYTFLGWSTNKSATSPTYAAGGTLNTDVYSGNITLYAVWKKNAVVPVAIKTQPQSVQVKYGETAEVFVEATGDGLAYQWYYKNAGASQFSLTTTFTGPVYTAEMNATRNGRQIYCVITDAYGNSVQTETVIIRMAASIVTQPKSIAVTNGQTAKVTLKAMGDGLTYKWYYKNAGATKFSLTTSFTSNSYSVAMNEARAGRQIYCVVTDKYGNTVQSDTVTLIMSKPLVITTQPKTTYTKYGATAKVTVKAEGDGLTYQWYYRNADESTYSKSSNQKNTYQPVMNETSKDRRVYCIITDAYGNTVQTKTVIVRMAASIITQPVSKTVASGKTARVSVTALGDGLTYQWYIKNPGKTSFGKSSVTTASYSVTMKAAVDGRQIYCVITDKYGNTVITDVVTLSMQ